MKLLDTDIFIDFLRGTSYAHAFIERHADEIIFAAITEAELLSGKMCNNSRERENLLHFLSQFEKIPLDNPLVQIAGDLRRTYTIEMPDAIIAATALVVNATLVTRNKKDFEKIKELIIEVPY